MLTLKDIARNALKNWDRLGATTGKTQCMYRYPDGTGCLVGVSLTEEQIAYLDSVAQNAASVMGMRDRGYGLDFFNEDDLFEIARLQDIHDGLCEMVENEDERQCKLEEFRDELKQIAAE